MEFFKKLLSGGKDPQAALQAASKNYTRSGDALSDAGIAVGDLQKTNTALNALANNLTDSTAKVSGAPRAPKKPSALTEHLNKKLGRQ